MQLDSTMNAGTSKAVVLSGAARGMGASHAKALGKEGWHVIVTDVLPLYEVADELSAENISFSTYFLDVTSSASWAELAAYIRASDEIPPVCGMVNNAGITQRTRMWNTSDEDWQRVISINLTGTFYGMREIAPLLREAGGGSIVNISSVSGMTGHHRPGYAASKWAVRGLTKAAALDYADWNIRVNSVHPGVIDTPMTADAGPMLDAQQSAIPMRRNGRPEEVSNLVSFLLSEKSSYSTGSEFVVDGGFVGGSAWFQVAERVGDVAPIP